MRLSDFSHRKFRKLCIEFDPVLTLENGLNFGAGAKVRENVKNKIWRSFAFRIFYSLRAVLATEIWSKAQEKKDNLQNKLSILQE